MSELQAFILGLIQGLTEFLPVSSSGHLEIVHALFGIENENNLLVAVVLHSATVLSTIIVFRKDIVTLAKGFFGFKWDEPTRYVLMLLLSAVPVVILGLFFKDEIELFYSGRVQFVGAMLIVTAVLLFLANFVKSGEKEVSFFKSLVIGVVQAFAVLPGISRSGATIASGLLLGVDKKEMAKFSFLMVLIPIIGAVSLDLISGDFTGNGNNIEALPLAIGFITAFVSGLFACKWMVDLVKKGKLIYFAIYCLIIGLITIFAS
ncbi:MAG: undecaprenyl-diphosphate phosphatase [Chlorobi bacterium]|nr:undecaprenyl-diphosphate phosphatase [Chlorobiota bacterium]